MVTPSNKRNLQNFQDYGKTDNLLEFVRASGLNVQKYREALDALGYIFESLSFGEQPIYRNLDLNALQERKTEVKDIVIWMADSNKADMKTVAIELMGFLGWESFVSRLERCLLSEFKWERLTAFKALELMGSEQAVEILRVAIEDSDPEIREAVRKALKRKK